MGATRVSNRDIAEKLDTLIDLMTQAALPKEVEVPQPAIEQANAEGIEVGEIEVDKAYFEHMSAKAKAYAVENGAVVLYARRNRAGQLKLAFAKSERYSTQIARQPSHLGPLATFGS